MTGAVYAKTYKRAVEKLFDIIKRYRDLKFYITNEHHNNKEFKVVFSNGDIWYAYQHNGSNSCGRRYNIIYIDNQFSDDEKLTLRTCATLPPYTGITYFS